MTRKEELEERVEKLASRFERIGESQAKYEIVEALIQVEREVWSDNRGEFWSFLRCVLEQGSAIRQDYQAGKFKGYEEYSARLDAAARERVDEWLTTQQREMT